MKISRSRFLLAICAVPLAVLTACGGGSGDNLDDRLNVAEPQLRFVHAIPLGPNLTMTRNGADEGQATNVPYKYASPYFDIRTEDTDLSLKLASSGTVVGTLPRFRADRGHKYTVVAVPGSSQSDMMFIDDPYNKGILSDNARARVVNASFNAQTIDVYLTKSGVDIATVNPQFPAVAYKSAVPGSGSDAVDNLEGGTYVLRVTTAGTKNVIFTNTVDIAKNADWLIVTTPSGGTGFLTPNDIKVLVTKANDAGKTMQEFSNAP